MLPPKILKATEAATKLRLHSENHESPPLTPPSPPLPPPSDSFMVPKLRWRRRRGGAAAQDAAWRVEAIDSQDLTLVLWNEKGAGWNAWAWRAKRRSTQELMVAREQDMASGARTRRCFLRGNPGVPCAHAFSTYPEIQTNASACFNPPHPRRHLPHSLHSIAGVANERDERTGRCALGRRRHSCLTCILHPPSGPRPRRIRCVRLTRNGT